MDIQAGRSYSDSHAANAVFVESVFNEHGIGWVDGRRRDRFASWRLGVKRDAVVFAGGARFHYGDAGDWYHPLFFSFQPAYHFGNTQALSSSLEFVSTLGWQGRHVSFQVRHISNGGLHDPSRGETMGLVGVGFDL